MINILLKNKITLSQYFTFAIIIQRLKMLFYKKDNKIIYSDDL